MKNRQAAVLQSIKQRENRKRILKKASSPAREIISSQNFTQKRLLRRLQFYRPARISVKFISCTILRMGEFLCFLFFLSFYIAGIVFCDWSSLLFFPLGTHFFISSKMNYEQKFKLKTRIKLKTYKAFDVNWSLVNILRKQKDLWRQDSRNTRNPVRPHLRCPTTLTLVTLDTW